MDTKAEILNLSRKFFNETGLKTYTPGKDYLPASGKVLDADDVASLVESGLDAWLTAGVFAKKFEKDFATFMGQKYSLLVNSGSSANLLAFATLTSPQLGERQITPGDEVITVAAGFPTTVNPIFQHGCVAVFLDVSLNDFGILVDRLEQARTHKTKAVFIAHALGNPFDVAAVKAFCDANKLWLIEDCCDAVGAQYDGKSVGQFGDICTVSFYPAHHMTMGEGGAVLTSSPQLKKIAESFRDWGRDCWCPPGKDNTCKKRWDWDFDGMPEGYDHKYIYTHIGYNLKATDMQAAVGCTQLKKLPGFIKKRNENYVILRKMIEQKLPNHKNHLLFCETLPKAQASWFGFPLTLLEKKRTPILRYLEDQKIGTRLLFGGNLIRQPLYKGQSFKVIGDLKNTDKIMASTFWVGLWPAFSEAHLDYISDHIVKAIRG
jgi:CDP-6-deoxy-D-xylo-4-hexulose-3-dehydrase